MYNHLFIMWITYTVYYVTTFEKNQKITLISDNDPILDNISVQGRCISIWHSHKLNEAHNPCSLDLILLDAQACTVPDFFI